MKFLKKYLIDILLLIGILMILQPSIGESYRCCSKQTTIGRINSCREYKTCYKTDWDDIGKIVIFLAIDITIRKYWISRKNKKIK